jgi:hypothetical protein
MFNQYARIAFFALAAIGSASFRALKENVANSIMWRMRPDHHPAKLLCHIDAT